MVTLGIYEHCKSYRCRVLGVGLLEATLQPVVIYEALYDNDKSKLWVRPLVEFESSVEMDSKTVSRFKRISDES